MKEVVPSTVKCKTGATFYAGCDAYPIRTTLKEMGHKQPVTYLQMDNSTAEGFANNTINPKQSKHFDMHYFWIQYRVLQGQFKVCWKCSMDNYANYFTNHHPSMHHHKMWPLYLHKPGHASRGNKQEPLLGHNLN